MTVNCSSRYYKDCDVIRHDFSRDKKVNCAIFHKECQPTAFDWRSESRNWAKVETEDQDYRTLSREKEKELREFVQLLGEKAPPPISRPGVYPHHYNPDEDDIPVYAILLIVFGSLIVIALIIAVLHKFNVLPGGT